MATIDNPLDEFNKLAVNLPQDHDEAGYVQLTFRRSATSAARTARITAEGELRVAHTTRLFDCDFNGAAAGALINNQWNQQATTMATALNGGFLRFNSGVVTTINTGVSINTWRSFCLRDHMNLKLSGYIRHINGSVPNKQVDFGFGYYDVAANQSAAMNEFVGFRWTQTGGLIAVLEYSVGGAPTSINAPVNGGVPYSDNVSRSYEIVIGEEGADYWVDGELVASIPLQPDAAGLFKSATYPVVFRMMNGASAPPLAAAFDFGSCGVSSIGPFGDEERNVLQVAMGRHALRAQAGVQAANGATNAVPASGTSPTATVGSNTASALTGLGGFGRCTLTGVTATVHTEIMVDAYQNPLIPEAVGSATNARNLVITDIMISPLLVSVALTGGGFSAQWFVAFGGTAVSLATADAIGGANIGTKSAVRLPLPITDTVAAAAAVGTIFTRSGEAGHIPLQTPIVLAPGEWIQVGFRTLFVTALVSAGAVDYGIGFSGYWM